MEYKFKEIEDKWQSYWSSHKTFKVDTDPERPKFYVLDMFPYPSGAGLHVGHPLGYIASDIYSRYKRLRGYNVLHPMGYDAFGLPAEQYAIQTGQPPQKQQRTTLLTQKQLDKLGFSYDWDREYVPAILPITNGPVGFSKCSNTGSTGNRKAEPIETLTNEFVHNGNRLVRAAHHCQKNFAEEWLSFTDNEKEDVLMCYRIAYW